MTTDTVALSSRVPKQLSDDLDRLRSLMQIEADRLGLNVTRTDAVVRALTAGLNTLLKKQD